MQFPDLASGDFWISLLTLTFLEIVLGIDNIIFITIVASRLHKKDQKRARSIGLVIAMLFRVVLLFGITAFMSMQKTLFSFDFSLASGAVSIQSLILIAGGLFLLYKAASEILKSGGIEHPRQQRKKSNLNSIIQISLLNLVFL
jgi:predicted tellurium resistance membrane protein TerC